MACSLMLRPGEAKGAPGPLFASGSPVRSLSSVAGAAITMKNNTPYTLTLIWLNYFGEQVVYGSLKAGQTKTLHTFVTHPWIFKAVEDPAANAYLALRGTKKQVLFPDPSVQMYHIDVMPDITWSPSVHLAMCEKHPEFKRAVQTLLLSHHRLSSSETVQTRQRAQGTRHLRASRRAFNAALGCFTGSSTGTHPDSRSHAASGSTTACARRASSGGERAASLQDLPLDVLLLIVKHMAPRVPDVSVCDPSDIVLPGPCDMELHMETVAMVELVMMHQLVVPSAPPHATHMEVFLQLQQIAQV